jgi:hypothetical protein
LFGGNAAASVALDGWIWVHLHKVIQAFQTVQISTGADHWIVSAHFTDPGVAAGFARGTGVCFSTWLAVAHSACLAGLFLPVFFTTRNYFKP